MKSVLRSAKPYWIYLILTGQKTVEVGKTFPMSGDWNRIVEMYCSKDKKSFNRIPEADREWMRKYLGKVACRFVCDRIDDIICLTNGSPDGSGVPWYKEVKGSCLTTIDLMRYGKRKPLFGWHISDLVIYDKPKELRAFRKAGFMTEDQWLYALYPNTHCHYSAWAKKFEITRAPQSWCYVEGL